jgi:hypothetical protein
LENINLAIIAASFPGTVTFAPVVDGTFITQSPTEILARGVVNGVRII